MTAETDNIVLEHLRALRANDAYYRRQFAEIQMRPSSIESHLTGDHIEITRHTHETRRD